MFPSGRGGLAFAAAVIAADAIGNHRRRKAAELETQPRWRLVESGVATVSTHGFYLQTPTGLHPWSWHSISAASIPTVGVVHLYGESKDGPVSWMVTSFVAELIFVLWALNRYPAHPQLRLGTWVPADWTSRARQRVVP
jgi:hypothetical protein